MSDKIQLSRANLKEENAKVRASRLWQTEEEKDLVASMQHKFGVDIRDSKEFPVQEAGFFENAKAKLREADQTSAFPQVLRAGVQSIVNAMYETVETSYDEWVTTVASDKKTELYAPIQGIGFVRQVGENELFPETGAVGMDLSLTNRKFGLILPISKELLGMDKTGQFAKQAGIMGEYCKLAQEVYAMGKLASVAGMKYADLDVPVSETKMADEATWPWSTSLVGGGANRPASFGLLNQGTLEAAYTALMNQRNRLGLKMLVQPSRLVVGPKLRYSAATLLHSTYYPTGATPGSLGGTFSINPLVKVEGTADLTVSRFMFKNDGTCNGDSTAWYLVDGSKPWFVMQQYSGPIVEQENPLSGQSFERDVSRFKCSVIFNADHIDSRFAYQGNDGSVV
jgi:phage major head subunit gpT-like protein